VTEENKMDGATRKALAARLKGTLIGLRGAGVPASKPKAPANPFAVSGGSEANDTGSEGIGATGTDDVPF